MTAPKETEHPELQEASTLLESSPLETLQGHLHTDVSNPFAMEEEEWAEQWDLQDGALDSPTGGTMKQRPGIELLTGIVADVASLEEQAHFQSLLDAHPSAQDDLSALQEFVDEQEVPLSLEAHLQRGEALLAQMSPLPDAFWTAIEEESPSNALSDNEADTSLEQVVSEVWGMSEVVEEVPEASPVIGEPEEKEERSLFQHPATWGVSAFVAFCALALLVVPALRKSSSGNKPAGALPADILPLGPMRTRMMGAGRDKPPVRPSLAPQTRTIDKPGVQFQIEHRRKGVIRVLKAKVTKIQRGDELRFRYRSTLVGQRYLLLFQMDNRGDLSRLYPSHEASYTLASSKTFRALKGGAIQAPATRFERLYVCVSQKPLSYNAVQQWLKSEILQHGVQNVSHLKLGCEYQYSWLLEREKP